MRDRLIGLLNYIPCNDGCACSALDGGRCGDLDKLDRCQIEAIADHLLANGVIVPPCKVGDTVYEIRIKGNTPKKDYGLITKRSLKESIRYYSERLYIKEKIFSKSDRTRFGRTVFLSREEAEATLKGGTE